jgi:hypothetical protein
MARIALIISVAGLLLLSTGCTTAPLGGTRWYVVDVVDPDPSDRADLESIQTVLVEFHPSGKLVTTTFKTDGTVEVEDEETYSIEEDVIEISHPDYERVMLYRFEGDVLRIHDDYGIVDLKRLPN